MCFVASFKLKLHDQMLIVFFFFASCRQPLVCSWIRFNIIGEIESLVIVVRQFSPGWCSECRN